MTEDPHLRDNYVNYKRDIIPSAWKQDIDRRLLDDLHLANRYFAASNPEIVKQIRQEAEYSPDYFYLRLKHRWEWHHSFYEELLEPAVGLMLERNLFSLSPHQVSALIESYKASSVVDQATVPVSAAIKPHLNKWVDIVGMSMTDDERVMLLNPPRSTFWAEYARDHIQYFIYLKEDPNRAGEYRKQLLKKYHADDEDIFAGRIKKFQIYRDRDPSELDDIKQKLEVDKGYATRHFYSTLEKPQAKAIRDIVIYDNYDEYMILMGLVGISGYVLRKSVLQYLNDSRILPNEGYIYQFDDDEIIDGLLKLRRYRKEVLHKRVKPYAQTGLTCGASGLLMALSYYGLLDATPSNEYLLNRLSSSAHIDGNHFSGLALQAGQRGLETILVHSESDMFKNPEYMPHPLFRNLMDEYRNYLNSAVDHGTKVINGQDINTQLVKDFVEKDYLVLIAGSMNSYLHTWLGVGYNQGGIMVNDPLGGRVGVKTPSQLNEFINTPMGKWMLAVRKNQQALTNLRNEIPRYTKQAFAYLVS